MTLRDFLQAVAAIGAAAGGMEAAAEPVVDTWNGLVAFIVPGPDSYSVAQGVSTPEPGGIDANVTQALMATMDLAAPVPRFSAIIAGLLNKLAAAVNPAADGFARLAFAEKVAVFRIIDGDPALAPFALLPALVAFLAYSEAGVFDPATQTLTGWPVGWTITGYPGVADGRNDFKGYFQGRRKA